MLSDRFSSAKISLATSLMYGWKPALDFTILWKIFARFRQEPTCVNRSGNPHLGLVFI